MGRRCDRAREWVSLHVDGELSEFELTLLREHLRRCDDCLRFAEGVSGATTVLRSAPLERLDQPVGLPSRARIVRASYGRSSVAALIVAAVGLSALWSVQYSAERVIKTPVPNVAPSTNRDLREVRVLRAAQIKPADLLLARPSRGLKTF